MVVMTLAWSKLQNQCRCWFVSLSHFYITIAKKAHILFSSSTLGVGIVGKGGKQASLAVDFAVTLFSFLTKLLLWHGRNSYRRSAKLAQFVIHRVPIISIIQAVFSSISYFAPIPLWLMVGYTTIYTMAPVFLLVLDRDVNEDLALLYPELYKELMKVCHHYILFYVPADIGLPGSSIISHGFLPNGWWLVFTKVLFFFTAVFKLYLNNIPPLGAAIMIMSLVLFENKFLHIVSISFTALILNELFMVALEITTW
jgi:phospholipid-translocating ATPase